MFVLNRSEKWRVVLKYHHPKSLVIKSLITLKQVKYGWRDLITRDLLPQIFERLYLFWSDMWQSLKMTR